ncbi:hypothetical protein LEMLEM_LOCUS8034 [Lemmus lemmus]
MTVRHFCSWQHQLLQDEDGHKRSSLWNFLAIWSRNCSCLDTVMYELDIQDSQRNTC